MNYRSTPHRDKNGVLSIRPFRALWIALSLSSLGDWLSILALAALAPSLTNGGGVAKSSAVGGVFLATLLPALLLGPIAGALADRLDRRKTMIVGDVIRGLLFVSIPLFPNLTWIYAAKFLAGIASQFWNPAAAATMPNLVPREKLERANQLSLVTTYGTAPLAAGVFSILALVGEGMARVMPHAFGHTNNVDLALYFNAATYFVSAITIYFLKQISKFRERGAISVPSTAKAIWEGFGFIMRTPAIRGLVIGMLGAFSAAGVIVGLGYSYITETLHGGSAGWGLVFAAIFIGMALGMAFGTRVFGGLSRRRLFGVTLTSAAVPLALIGLIPNLIMVVLFVVIMGAISGIAYPLGFTIVGLEVDDDTRGRVFAFFQSTIQVILLTVIAVVPFLAAAFTGMIQSLTGSGDVKIGNVVYGSAGQNVVILLAAVIVAFVGISSYRRMDDRKGVPLRDDMIAAIRGSEFAAVPGSEAADGQAAHHGLFVAFEGGEGTGKTTQSRLISIWLRDQGYDVVSTHEPGATKIGMRLRALLLDTAHTGMSPHAEVLMYAADRAEHVASVIDPALRRGAVVITDRYIDSTLAYQGDGRGLRADDIARLNAWATGGRVPELTVLMDMPPEAGLGRRARSADRLEAEPAEFHNRVRSGFLNLAKADPSRYLVIDATRPLDAITEEIKDRIRELLPDPVPYHAEAATGTFPAITDPPLSR